MFTKVFASAGLALVALVGCAAPGGPPLEALDPSVDRVPEAHLTDAQLFAGPVLERDGFVRATLSRNPSVGAAREAWRGASARARQAGSLEDPMIAVEIAPLSIGSSSARFGYSAMVSQRIPWPGKLSLDETIVRAEADAAKVDLQATRRDLALTAALLYDQYFVAVRSIEVNEQHVALTREMKGAALARLETGRGTALDPLQAEAELAHLEHDAVVLASQRDITVAQMNELLHREPDLSLPPPTHDLALAPAPDTSSGPRLEAEAIKQRPEIEATRLHARAEEARGERAKRESYPDLTASTSYNSMWDTPEHRWMIGIGVNVPLQLARRAASVEEASATRARFENETARLTDKARTEVIVGLKRLVEATHVLTLYETRLLPIAREQVDVARAGFVTSQSDFVAVIGAEKNLRGIELEYQMMRATVDGRSAELEHALGLIPALGRKAGDR